MGTAEGWKKLETGKSTSLIRNQMEELLEGPVFHIGTNRERVMTNYAVVRMQLEAYMPACMQACL